MPDQPIFVTIDPNTTEACAVASLIYNMLIEVCPQPEVRIAGIIRLFAATLGIMLAEAGHVQDPSVVKAIHTLLDDFRAVVDKYAAIPTAGDQVH